MIILGNNYGKGLIICSKEFLRGTSPRDTKFFNDNFFIIKRYEFPPSSYIMCLSKRFPKIDNNELAIPLYRITFQTPPLQLKGVVKIGTILLKDLTEYDR